jgi:hypothetical protein
MFNHVSLRAFLNEQEERLNNLRTVVQLMENPIFVMTGSRRFGQDSVFSDYDYFVKSSTMDIGLREKLERLGFVRKYSESKYKDPSLSYVMEFGSLIDLQIIYDDYYDAKVRAQDLFQKLVNTDAKPLLGIGKEEMRNIWTNLIHLSR